MVVGDVLDRRAQRAAVEFLFDGELWKTDSASRLLSRNEGELAVQGRLRTWVALRASRTVDLLGHVSMEAGNAEEEATEVYLEQLELRARLSPAFSVEAGKVLQPIGAFGLRRFSNTNPLIGSPDAYPPQYPWGAVATGRVSRFDYRVALSSLPAVNAEYTPPPDHFLRPVAGVGVSFGPAFRLGATVAITPRRSYTTYRFRPEDPAPNLAARALRRLGREPVFRPTGGGSDASVFNEWGVPTVVLSCGYQNAHSIHETVALADMELAAAWCVSIAEEAAL